MESTRSLAIAVLAALALLMVGTASASAAPAWYECAKAVPTNSGDYSNSKCTEASEPGKGKYEIVPGVGKGKAFKGKFGKLVLHMVIPGKGDRTTECASGTAEGTAAMPNKVVGVVVTLTKCKAAGEICRTEGSSSETIKTEQLEGELGWLSEEHGEIGLALTSEAAPAKGYIALFNCEGFAKERWSGYVIAEQVGDYHTISKTTELIYGVGPYLGELKPGYTPQTNPPGFEEGALGVLETELNGSETGNTWQPEGGLPSGWSGDAENKGEALLVK